MFRPFFYLIISLSVLSCSSEATLKKFSPPQKRAQWIDPLFYNDDFDNELNFPLWFDDSLVKTHQIYKITKRIFKNEELDSNGFYAIPKEKIEFYFDPNGFVYRLVVYSYLDDREISRATFIYEGNMQSSGYRKVKALPVLTLQNKNAKDEFTTDFFQDATHQYSIYSFLKRSKKYLCFKDDEKQSRIFAVKNKKNWGPLSIDSILHPEKNDWIILGSLRHPYKRYKVENIVRESSVFKYRYWKSGVLKYRIKEVYPFTFKRSYLYGKNHEWVAYIDSTFSENEFLMRSKHHLLYDEFQRPVELIHYTEKVEGKSNSYRETLSYRTKNK